MKWLEVEGFMSRTFKNWRYTPIKAGLFNKIERRKYPKNFTFGGNLGRGTIPNRKYDYYYCMPHILGSLVIITREYLICSTDKEIRNEIFDAIYYIFKDTYPLLFEEDKIVSFPLTTTLDEEI